MAQLPIHNFSLKRVTLTEKVKETRKFKVLHKTLNMKLPETILHTEKFRCIEISVIIAKKDSHERLFQKLF